MPPERPPPPPPRGGRARTVMASDAAQRPLGPRVLSATTTTSQQATRPHQLVADAAQAAATNQARHPSRTLPVQTARGRLEGGPAGSAPPRRTHVRGGASAPEPSLAHAGRPYRSAELNAVGACSAWLLPHMASDADLGAAADAQRHALGDTVTGVTADTTTDTHRHAQAKRRVAAEVSVAATGSGCSGVELCMCACICI
jgi:hypothetical protein